MHPICNTVIPSKKDLTSPLFVGTFFSVDDFPNFPKSVPFDPPPKKKKVLFFSVDGFSETSRNR